MLALLVLSVLAISTAKGKWMLINLGIILGFICVGFGIGVAMGAWGGNMAIGGMAAVPLSFGLGAVGALGCWRRNKMRDKLTNAATSVPQ